MNLSQSILLDPYSTNTNTARIAIWAFDILKYPYPNLWLVLVDRPDWDKVYRLAASLGRDDHRIAFVTDTSMINPIITWKIGPTTTWTDQVNGNNVTVTQPSALCLAQETHRVLSIYPPG